MNYAEEQLQHAIEKEEKGNNMDKDYKSLWEDSVKENKKLEEENTNLANEKYDLEIEMGSLVMKNKQLEDNLISKEKCNDELKSKITGLEEIIDNYMKEIDESKINELINKNIFRILKELLTRTNDNEIKELMNMIDILRLTKI